MTNKRLHLLGFMVILVLLTACGRRYKVEGISSIADLDGRKLYLKTFGDSSLVSIDSCEVADGKFNFSGTVDSAIMASIFLDDQNLMPIVLDKGTLNACITEEKREVNGSTLNESLYQFLAKKNKLDTQMAALSNKESQMIMDGENPEAIQLKISDEAQHIADDTDYLVTSFITENSDNVLGVSVFMTLVSAFRYPVMTPQIEDIMSKAKPFFKNNKDVNEFIRTAQENMKRMQDAEVRDYSAVNRP